MNRAQRYEIPKIGSDWVKEEFQDISFGDKRLDRRFIKLMNLLGAKHESSINQACED